MGCATYRLLDSLAYIQAFQYEPLKATASGPKRDGVIFITTDETKDVPSSEKQNDLSQQDATYLAINFAFLTKENQDKLNFDTSNGQGLLV